MSSVPASNMDDAFANCAIAHVDDRAWSILCGAEGCEEPVAACGWLDVQFYMILNSTNEAAAQRALDRLPHPKYRTYRMCAEFKIGWRRGPDGVWREAGSSLRRMNRPGAPDPLAQRVINGRLTAAALHQEAEPPAYVECARCGTVNLIQRHQRVGLPGFAE